MKKKTRMISFLRIFVKVIIIKKEIKFREILYFFFSNSDSFKVMHYFG